MDVVDAHFAFVTRHLYALVFGAFLIEGAGLPLPSRMLLIVAGSLVDDARGMLMLVIACLAGGVLGDHMPFIGGRVAGTRILTLYCRLTLGSRNCVEKTVAYFVRFGPAAIMLSRFSACIRIFAAALSGCGHVSYRRFVTYDVIGSAVYAVLWVVVGHFVGGPAIDLLKRFRVLNLLLLAVPAALLGLLAYRLWRRARHGAALPAQITTLAPLCAPDVSAASAPPPPPKTPAG
jgi:membrane protein DedA with SNARE-associated domain